jgi:anti-anti-sigma factor
MLGTVIALYNRVRARGGRLRLAALRERHRRLLKLVRLDDVLEVHPTPEQAAAGLR